MTERRILITGGSGFIGTNLVEYFSHQGWDTRNFDILPPRNPAHQFYWTNADILDRNKIIEETQRFQPTVFLHFAARTDLDEKNSLSGYAANIEGVSNVIEAIRATPSIRRAIFASSQLVCKLGYRPHDDEDYCPSTLYGQSKVLTEGIVRSADALGAAWTILRPTSIWGPWFGVPYKNFFTAIARNLYIHPGNIRTLKQWGYVGNSVFQVDRLLQAPVEKVEKKIFYLADYEPVQLREFANKVQRATGARAIRTVPLGILKTLAWVGDLAQRAGWSSPPLTSFRYSNIVTDEIQDLRPLCEVTGPLPYCVDEAIERTVHWLRTYDQ